LAQRRSSRKRRKARQRSAGAAKEAARRPAAEGPAEADVSTAAGAEAPAEPDAATPAAASAPAEADVATPAADVPGEDVATPAAEHFDGEPDSDAERMARGYSRGRARDEAARAALVPLQPGERPLAVTIAGVVALVLALTNSGAYLAGLEVQGERPNAVGVGLFTLLLLTAAIGCLRVRYWAVLGMQALLGFVIIIFSLLLIRFGDLLELAIALAIIGSAGTLFWFLVKSMARIQMPERPGSRD